MGKYPNQKTIKIKRAEVDKSKQFLMINTEKIPRAVRELGSGVASWLYIYLLSNADGFKLDYSPQHFASLYGFSLNASKQAVNKLIDKGFLVADKYNKNSFTFYEEAQEEKPKLNIVIKQEKRYFFDGDKQVALTLKELKDNLKEKYDELDILDAWADAEVARND